MMPPSSYFAPYDHRPTARNPAVLELGEPEQLIEIPMFAVVDRGRTGRARRVITDNGRD